MKPKTKTLQHLGLIALAAFSAPAVHAANTTWVGNTDANFGTLANWNSVTPHNNSPFFGAAGTAGATLNNDIVGGSYFGLVFNSGASAYTIGGNSFTLSGDITNNSSSIQTINTAMTTTASRTFNATSGQLVLGGNITDSAGLTLNATNKITLAGTNTIATTTTGTNTFFALLVNAGAGGVDITGSTTVGTAGAGGNSFNGAFAMLGTSALTLQSGGSLTVHGSGTTSANTPNSIVGQNSAGTSTLLVNGGTLTIGASTGFVLGNGNNNNIAANGVLTVSSGTATINRGSLGTTTNGTDTRLIMMGRDSNSATGTINLNGGTLATDRQFVRDGSSTGQAGTANFVFGGGTLKALGNQTDWLQSTTATSGGQGGGTVNANAQALSSVTTTAVSTIDSNGFSVAINNAISGAGGFNIISSSGNGTVIFGGTNTYTGATTISGGTLALGAAGSIDNTSGVHLGTGGTFDVSAKSGYTVSNLSGSGTVTGALTISTQLAIGNSPGTVNFTDDLSLTGSTYLYELVGGGMDADLGNVDGNLTLTNATLDLVQLGTYTLGDKFTLFAYDGTLTGTFDGLADDTTFTDAGGQWLINYNDTTAGLNGGTGNSFVTVTAVPEPTAALLGALGMLSLLRRRRVH